MVFQVVSFLQVSPLKPRMHLSPHVLRAPPTSFLSIWSPEYKLLRSTHHKAPRYVVFSALLYLTGFVIYSRLVVAQRYECHHNRCTWLDWFMNVVRGWAMLIMEINITVT
jgi:hypothetical protein